MTTIFQFNPLSGQFDLVTNSLTPSEIVGGTPNTFAGFDGAGTLESIPGWSINTVTGGAEVTRSLSPGDIGGSNYFHQFQSNLTPSADLLGTSFVGIRNAADISGPNASTSYISFENNINAANGGSKGVIIGLNNNIDLGNTGDVSTSQAVTSLNQSINIHEDHTTTTSVQGLNTSINTDIGSSLDSGATLLNGGITLNGTSPGNISLLNLAATINGDMSGSGLSLININNQINSTTQAVNGVLLNTFHDAASSVVNGQLMFQDTTQVSSGANVGFIQSFQSNVNIAAGATTTGTAAFSNVSQFANSVPTFGFTGYQNNPTLSSDRQNGVAFQDSTQFLSGADISGDYQSASFGPLFQPGSTVRSYTGININPLFGGGTITDDVRGMGIFFNTPTAGTNITGLDIALNNATSSGGSITGLNVNVGNSVDANPQGVYGFQTNGRVGVNAQTQLVSNQGFQIGNRIAIDYLVPSGSPVTNTDSLGNNFAGNLIAEDDVSNGGFGIGWNSVGFIASAAIAAGKTIESATVFLPALSLPAVGFTTGGDITELNYVRIFPPLPQGGTANITNLYGFKIDSKFGDFAASATNTWGMYLDTSAPNYMGKGDLQLGGATSGILSIKPAAVTTSHTLTMPAAQGAASTVLTNDGSGNLSWLAAGTSSPTTFNFNDNQSSFVNVTGFLVDPTSSHAFKAEMSVERVGTSGTPVLVDAEDATFYGNLAYSFVGGGSEAGSAVLSDGTIVLYGDNVNPAINFVKINADGTTNATFASNLGTGVDLAVASAAVQADDSIVFVGSYSTYNGVAVDQVGRVDADGVLDTAFNANISGSGPAGNPLVVAIQADQKILVGGTFGSFGVSTARRLVRLNSDGTLDSTFNTNLGTGFNNNVYSIAVQADQKILVGGQFTNFNGNSRNYLVRLNSDGTEDSTFITNIGSGFDDVVRAILEQSDTAIVVGGDFTTLNGSAPARLVRLNNDGTVDSTFNSNVTGQFTSGAVRSIGQQSSGKLVVSGSMTYSTGSYFARLNTDGTLDSAFTTSLGTGFNATVYGVTIQPNDQIIATGSFGTFDGNTRDSVLRYEVLVAPPAQDLITQQSIRGVYRSSTGSWTILSGESVGDACGVTFQMTDLGQLQYTSTALVGTPTLNVMKFTIEAL